MLILARFGQALGACVGPAIGRAAVRDIYGRERAARMLSYMGMVMALAPAFGPILGGFLEVWFGWRANFVVLTVFRSEEHTSELQSLMRISYAVFCLKKKKNTS